MDEGSNTSVVDDRRLFPEGAVAARSALTTKALSLNHRLKMAQCVHWLDCLLVSASPKPVSASVPRCSEYFATLHLLTAVFYVCNEQVAIVGLKVVSF